MDDSQSVPATATESRRPRSPILVIDDNHEIHQDFTRILGAEPPNSYRLDSLEARLFGETTSGSAPTYSIDSAHQGDAGVALAREAFEAGEPYGVAFVDARMPPGIDGVETIRQLLEVDPALHFVLCSAYADYSWEEISDALGDSDRFLILKKPFDPLEVRQLARALSHKSRLVRDHARRVAHLGELVRERTAQIELVNERLRAEVRERELSQGILAHTQRLQALGQLTAGIAHEINTPLASIRSNLAFIEERVAEIAPGARDLLEVGRAIRDAAESGARITKIVRDVKLFASPQEEVLGPVDVRDVLESSIALFGKKFERDVRIVREFATVPPAIATGGRLEQVFVNLLGNAIRAFAPGHDREPEIRVTLALRTPSQLVIEVHDNGVGIPEAHMPRLLEPFFTTRAVGEGTGLGLSVSHGIVTSFGGMLEIESTESEGTVVRVVLRASPMPAAVASPASSGAPAHDDASHPVSSSSPARAPAPDELRLLLVDDDEGLLRSLSRMLSKHRVVTCDSAEAALERIAAEEFDVILSDITMPGMSGIDLLLRLRSESPDIAERVVLMTGGILNDAAQEAVMATMEDRRLDKPFSLGELRAVIDLRARALRSRSGR